MPIRLSGLASGLDTEAIVGALVSAYSYKKDKYVKAQTKLSWKQDAWKTLNSKVYSLYTSVGQMRYSSNYSVKKATVSDTTKATATASGTAINGTQTLEVNQLAKTAYITGGKLDDSTTGTTTLAQLGLKNKNGSIPKGTIEVRTNTGNVKIDVDNSTTINQIVTKLNEAGVQANFDEKNHRFFVSSKSSGKAGDFTITANNETGLNSLIKLGLLSDTEVSSITSSATGADLVSKSFKYGTDGEWFGTADSFKTLLTKIKDNKAIVADENASDEEKAAAQKFLDDNADLVSALEEKYGTEATDGEGNTVYTIDWANLTENQITQMGNDIYSDSVYDESAQNFNKWQINNSVNAIRDAYIKLADIRTQNYDSVTAQEEAYAAAKAELDTVLADPTHAKWAKYIEENFGSVNSETDDSYSNFWIQSDNLELANSVYYRVDLSAQIAINGEKFTVPTDLNAHKINGQDAKITLNDVEYTSDTNSITVNGLSIEAVAETTSAITINVQNDTDALYDKVKDFLTSYNTLMNEMQKLYNADSAKDYEPLTEDEKAEMSESEIEKWEQKIKDSLLRRDTQLSGIISAMTMSMMKTYDVNGKTYAWSTFGVHTLGTLNAEKNEGYAYHIDGDSEDSYTSGNEEKLRAALADDPDTVIEFLKQVTGGLYKAMDDKMKSTAVKSVYTVYNDKEMASEYSDYSSLIKTWTERVTDMEDAYYKKFAAMEKALATLQGNSSSISSLLGG